MNLASASDWYESLDIFVSRGRVFMKDFAYEALWTCCWRQNNTIPLCQRFSTSSSVVFLHRYIFKVDAQMQSLQYQYAHSETLTIFIYCKGIKGAIIGNLHDIGKVHTVHAMRENQATHTP